MAKNQIKNLEKIRENQLIKYIADPIRNPKPKIRVRTILILVVSE
ncbi:hypothetical protein [Acetoanaerobium pronyense]|nr:hypothetical protein [Acetoanaerobium pronyense]